jgi:hypothetical protein
MKISDLLNLKNSFKHHTLNTTLSSFTPFYIRLAPLKLLNDGRISALFTLKIIAL